jgi:hypothetical protein
MTSRSGLFLLWFVVGLSVVAWSGMRLGSAQSQITAADAARSAIERDVAKVQLLRAQVRGLSVGRRPDGDLIARVQRALSDAGLPVSACSSVQPRADQTRPGAGVRVQTVVMTLRALLPAEFGAWLAAWRAGDQTWRLDDVQLTRVSVPTAPGAAVARSEGNRYDVALVLAAPYVEEDQ